MTMAGSGLALFLAAIASLLPTCSRSISSTWERYVSYSSADDNAVGSLPSYSQPTASGCARNNTYLLSCSGDSILLANLQILPITGDLFPATVSSISLTRVSPLTEFVDNTLTNYTYLTSLKVWSTGLTAAPDVSTTRVTEVDLRNNAIKMTTKNYDGWHFPDTLIYLILSNNLIHWIPKGWIDGPNLRIVSLANNQLLQLQHTALGNSLGSLIHMDLSNNQISQISKRSLAPLGNSSFKHLNLEANVVDTIESEAFSQIPDITVLQLRSNSLSKVRWNTFRNMEDLAYLDLRSNLITTLPKRAFENLPKLRIFDLSYQSPGLEFIAYNSWINIGASLEYLNLEHNNLPTFPHHIMCEDSYPRLEYINAGYNAITNSTEYDYSAFTISRKSLHEDKLEDYRPFSTYPALEILNLQHNQISYMNATDFCNMTNLRTLQLNSNQVRHETIEDYALACLPKLSLLDMDNNQIQYYPAAFQNSTGLPAIQTLDLSYNEITFLNTGAIFNLSTIISLNLINNRIVTIENDTFPLQIEKLYLAENLFRFHHEHPFSFLASLNVLQLQSNSISYLPVDAFVNCTSLQILYLQNNEIQQVRLQHFSNNPLTGSLLLANNEIGWIEDGTFSHISSMSSLSLANNKLTVLPVGGTFDGLRVTYDLVLSGNRIITLQDGVFNDVSARNIRLDGNSIVRIHTGAFHSVSATRLYLSNNKIEVVESNGLSSVSASYLNLTGNPLTTLEPYAFNTTTSTSIYMGGLSISHLPTFAFYDVYCSLDLDLSSGQLRTIDKQAFYNVRISRHMRLNNNKIEIVTQPMFGPGSTVNHLYLNTNGLTGISYDVFDNVTVSNIYLSSNNLVLVPNALSTIQPTIIDLSQNQIEEVPLHTLVGQLNLKTLYLQGNDLSHFPTISNLPNLESLYLSNNNIETIGKDAFTTLNRLSYIDLSSNPLGCQCQTVYALHAKASSISGGTCSYPLNTAGTKFSYTSMEDPLYYRRTEPDFFLCACTNLVATAVTAEEIYVEWERPATLYADIPLIVTANVTENVTTTPATVETTTASIPDNSSFMQTNETFSNETNSCNETEFTESLQNATLTYQLTCVSKTGSTLYTTVRDDCGERLSLNATFNATDGVLPGTTYYCAVQLEADGNTSASSEPVRVQTLHQTSDTSDSSLGLRMTIYDFSFSHPDFDDISSVSVEVPIYIGSPYGSWLAMSSSPNQDTFSDWFRSVPKTNFMFEDTVFLDLIENNTYRFWSDAFFPVDGFGYSTESQADCNGNVHNFGFTSAIRAGLKFHGSEVITVGGGDALWFYINKVLVVSHQSASNSTVMECHTVSLPASSTNGGDGIARVQVGEVANGTCGNQTAASSIPLDLEAGEVYHFDLFHVESRTCTSWLFLQVENTELLSYINSTSQLPVDYTVNTPEDLHVNGIVQTVDLADVFIIGPTFNLSLFEGNEGRHFTIKNDTEDTRADAEPPLKSEPVYTNVTTLSGAILSYIACANLSSTVDELNISSVEEFHVNTSTVLLTLDTELDYEVKTKYRLSMRVEDTVSASTGFVTLTINVLDVNDNCPEMNASTGSVTPIPTLQDSPVAHVLVSDTDSGNNTRVNFSVSDIVEYPNTAFVESSANSSYASINFTTFSFNVVAIDNGTPQRGSVTPFNITVNKECASSDEAGAIDVEILVSDNGGILFRIPRYWIKEFECSEDVGLSNGFVSDAQLSASSSYSRFTLPGNGRLHRKYDTYSQVSGGWVAAVADRSQFFQVDMLMPYKFTKVYIQGRDEADEWVTSFRLYYSDIDTGSWSLYTNGSGENIFFGNIDRSSVATTQLNPPVLGRYLRVEPWTWHGNISLRLELAGCGQDEQLYYDTTCRRCDATYFCDGTGTRTPCGRCDSTQSNTSCSRPPTEHSFGLQAQCSHCPMGWLCHDGYAKICPKFHYANCTDSFCPNNCTHCEVGYACKDGIRYRCGLGTFSDGEMEACTSCPGGTHQAAEAQGTCESCSSGFFSNRRRGRCDPCTTDTYSTPSSGECLPCNGNITFCPCLVNETCHAGVQCVNKGDGLHECGDCPPGFQGNGLYCIDINECEDYRPCWNYSACINTEPGYQCRECPDGYTGTYEDALAWNNTRRIFIFMNKEYAALQVQTCDDVDECQTDNGGCDPNMNCVNTVGSYYCDVCGEGYMGNRVTGCYSDDFCVTNRHTCSDNAKCIYIGPGQFSCKCLPGYAGDGRYCNTDSDNDGHPDMAAACAVWGCDMDRCRLIPNSVQEDADNNRVGDTCDYDDDNDYIYDENDNCQTVKNFNQTDTDGDLVGDACDNCVNESNPDQIDTDNDGLGNACDDDDDNDGVLDVGDNCPLVANAGQENDDGDTIGNACDNCVQETNENQADTDNNGVGDVGDVPGASYKDKDGDSVLDFLDNCPEEVNADQSDIDNDGLGDLCDPDLDGDGVDNEQDNCPYWQNPLQQDIDGDGVGDACTHDADKDGTLDGNDTCPHNPLISATTFIDHFTVDLYPRYDDPPVWQVHGNGAEITQLANTKRPVMLIGNQAYGEIEYEGTWYVDNHTAEDWVGFVFGYVNNRKFYAVLWKRTNYNFLNHTYQAGITGIQIKAVNAVAGPTFTLSKAMWHSADTSNYVSLLWQDPTLLPWEPKKSYRWSLIHRPSTGFISLTVYQGSTKVVDSGPIYNSMSTGGRIGVVQFGPFITIWSNLRINCLTRHNKALHLDGQTYVPLGNVSHLVRPDLNGETPDEQSITFEAWISIDEVNDGQVNPIFCTEDNAVSLSVVSGRLVGQYEKSMVSSGTNLTANTWYNVILRCNRSDQTITLFLDGNKEGVATDVSVSYGYNTTSTLNLGKGNDTFFAGAIDEVRVYGIEIPDGEMMEHISAQSLAKRYHQGYLKVHLKMDDPGSGLILPNAGLSTDPVEVIGKLAYVDSYQNNKQFRLTYPSN